MAEYTYTIETQDLYRGDTIRLRTFQYAIDGTPVTITDAKMNIRDASNKLVYDVPLVVVGDLVTQPNIAGSITKKFPIGILDYDIEITMTGGLTRTYLKGTYNILKDSSYE